MNGNLTVEQKYPLVCAVIWTPLHSAYPVPEVMTDEQNWHSLPGHLAVTGRVCQLFTGPDGDREPSRLLLSLARLLACWLYLFEHCLQEWFDTSLIIRLPTAVVRQNNGSLIWRAMLLWMWPMAGILWLFRGQPGTPLMEPKTLPRTPSKCSPQITVTTICFNTVFIF